MSRPLRILQKIQTRLLTVNGESPFTVNLGDRVYLGREDIFAAKVDAKNFPCASILESDELTLQAQPGKMRQELPITIQAGTLSDPENPIIAGHELWADLMRALFPESATDKTGTDRLDGEAIVFEYVGRQILPREDGGKTTSVFIDCRAEYVLQPGNPDL